MDDAQAPEVSGYDVGRLLGRGGSADVWLAREQGSGRDCALKCFRSGGSRLRGSAALSEEDVRREVRILSVLDHQHLIKAHDVVRMAAPGGGTALSMDYAAGGSLGQLVAARGRLSVGETVTVLTPIAQVLGYLHGKGFTHSDVSPGNVLFTGQGKPMLSDLGVARMLGDPGSTGTAGTGGFLDPSPVDAVRAGLQPGRDIYSVAALGWFCLTGEAPGRTADRPPLPLLVPGVPRDLAAALEAGLNEDRRLRPDALAFATAVYRSAEPQPVDLSDAVHPTVLPELLTRRHIPATSKGGSLRVKLQGLRRRAVTSRWSDRLVPQENRGQRQSKAAQSPGKHADVPAATRVTRRLLHVIVPAIAAAAGIWWLSAVSGQLTWPDNAAAERPAVPASPSGDAAVGRQAVTPVDDARQRAGAADPVAAVQGLAALRDYAFSSGTLELLAEVNAPGSAAAAADERTAGQLHASKHRLDGFSSTLSGMAVEDGGTPHQAVVRITSATSGYRTVSAEGTVLAAGAPSAPQPIRLVLVFVDGRWRISDILAAPGSG
ncbi:protein kinase domain-containing protein [Arthrobacter sp. SLBN-122]|uniref:protein kinase domain-containing protein n=1 Tax=Arthrobacter sp. SLBN-122 TaxID=2768455 RepID=UPI0011503029|nr:protein kinase [Arthrobacter sp. SLBN-122]TQJ36176.1 serine/threonine protein kinase [Arthrobacter sp. SLBN-122]